MSRNQVSCRIMCRVKKKMKLIVEILRLRIIALLYVSHSIAILPITIKNIMYKKLNKLILLHCFKTPV